jgi:hypothetical protein
LVDQTEGFVDPLKETVVGVVAVVVDALVSIQDPYLVD